jgi:hypothetical protein
VRVLLQMGAPLPFHRLLQQRRGRYRAPWQMMSLFGAANEMSRGAREPSSTPSSIDNRRAGKTPVEAEFCYECFGRSATVRELRTEVFNHRIVMGGAVAASFPLTPASGSRASSVMRAPGSILVLFVPPLGDQFSARLDCRSHDRSFPLRSVPTPNAAEELMACRCPVIARRVNDGRADARHPGRRTSVWRLIA